MSQRQIAIGDAQAPLSQLRAIFDRNDLLLPDGNLQPDVFLIAIGDYFDYGSTEERAEAGDNGLRLLQWLASHPPEQVVLIAGNHDLGRVGELAEFSDEQFARAHEMAKDAYRSGDTDKAAEARLLAHYPALPSAEIAARDFAAFTHAQRELVIELLQQRRLKLAYATDDTTLFCHAGITTRYLARLGLPENAKASTIADALNVRLYDAFGSWTSGPLAIQEIHMPGQSQSGEGVGMLYHRPANPSLAANADYDLEKTMSRRYDARDIPTGITQVVGHISDKKCRQLLGNDWCSPTATPAGAIRSMVVRGDDVRYGAGVAEADMTKDARMVFIDGGMNRTSPGDYELFRF